MKFSKTALALVLTFLLLGCQHQQNVRVLRLAHGLDTSHPVHQGMVHMAEQLKQVSAGNMEIRIYPSGQLGSERECLELLQVGSLDMTKVSAAVMENFAPVYQILSLPYLFTDKEHAYQVLDGEIGQRFLEQGSNYRLRGLCFYDAGSRSFYTKDKPITKPEDLKGLKIRVQKSQTAVDMVNSLGGSPTPIPWGELYTALQQGVVDGAENNPPSFYLSGHYEVCKYYSINEHTAVPDVLLVGTGTWDRLSETEKGWLSEAAKRSALFQRKVWQQSEQECIAKMKEEGVTVSYPDKQTFAEGVQPLYDRFANNAEYSSIIEDIQQSVSKQEDKGL
ncbi:MAG: TRAP transporter substrate-binding protein [Bacteroidota bacterium]